MALALVAVAAAPGYGAAPEDYRFGRVSLAEGLSQVSVYCILQDDLGFLWVGGEYGLNRYDGHAFATYAHVPGDPASLSGNQVRALAVDPTGALWVGTFDSGLNLWDPTTNAFTRFRHEPADPRSLASDTVTALAVGGDGSLWVGTDSGLDRLSLPYDGESTFTHFRQRSDDHASLSDDWVSSLYSDSVGRLWVGTEAGLDRLDPGSDGFIHYGARPVGPSALADDHIRCLAGERSGKVWVGTLGGGLSLLDPSTGEVQTYRSWPGDPSTLSGDSISAVHQDRSGRVWVATEAWGLDLVDPESGRILHFPADADDPDAIQCRHLNVLLEDRSEILWIGTTFAGLQRLDLKGSPFTVFGRDQNAARGLQSSVVFSVLESRDGSLWVGTESGLDHVDLGVGRVRHFEAHPDRRGGLARGATYALLEDHQGHIWVGTWGGGLARLGADGSRFVTFLHRPGDPNSLGHDVVLALLEDYRHNLWIGTLGGLDLLDLDTGRFSHYRADPEVEGALDSDHVKCLFQDSAATLWVGTIGGGLGRLDPGSEEFTVYRHDPVDPFSLSDDNVASVMESSTGELWVGTAGGLNRLDRSTGRFTALRVADGLASDAITGALEDEKGRIWVAHFGGLSRIEPVTGEIVNLDQGDGLPANEFNSSAYCRGRGGELMFGGVEGLVVFDPSQVWANPYPPRVAITSFKVYGEEVDLGGSTWLAAEIFLDHGQDFISFEFVGLELTAPDQIDYAYLLEGFDRDWVESGGRRFASYTNLAPGDYTFRVKAANGAGVWGEETRVRVVMSPPFWQTWWFKAAAAMAILLALAAAFSWRTRALREKISEQERVERIIRESRDQLRQANFELEGYSTGLESMVEERTRQLEAANQELQALATSDGLTGVANRRRFEEVIDGEWRRAYRFGRPLSVLMADIDCFKTYNDALGHQAGDECLRRVATVLAGLLNRPGELLARYGGEEFVAVLPETDRQAAGDVAERMRRAVEDLAIAHPGGAATSVVTVSVGAATVVPSTEAQWTSLVESADRALYAAKAAGRNRVEISPSSDY